MSCDSNFSRYARQAGASASMCAALGGGDAARAAAALEEIVELARGRAEQALRARGERPGTAHKVADLAAMAGCSRLFERMQAASIRPPAHGRPRGGMPFAMPEAPAAMYAYAAVDETLTAIEGGRPLPPLAREVLLGARARAAAAAPARVPLSPGQRYTREQLLDACDGDAVVVRLTRLDDADGRVAYAGPAVLHVQRAHVPPRGSRRAARPSDPEQAVLIALKDREWAEYATGHDMDGNGALVSEDYQMEVFAPPAPARCPDCGEFVGEGGHACRAAGVDWDPYAAPPFAPPDPAPDSAPADAQARAFVTRDLLGLLSEGWPVGRGARDDTLHSEMTATLDAAARHLQGRADLPDDLRRAIADYRRSRAEEGDSTRLQSRDAQRQARWQLAAALTVAAGRPQCETCGRVLDAAHEHACAAREALAAPEIGALLRRGEVAVSAVRRIARDLSGEVLLPPDLGDAVDRAAGWGGPADEDGARFLAVALDETINRPLSGTPRERARQALKAYDIRLVASGQLPFDSSLSGARQRFAFLRAARALRGLAHERERAYLDYALRVLRGGEAFPDGGAQLAAVIARLLYGTGPLNR